MKRELVALPILAALCACATADPKSLGEAESGYTYVPIDPLPVTVVRGEGCPATPCQKAWTRDTLLQALPDNAVRILVEQYGVSGSVSYGPAKIGAKKESYVVTMDYINADTVNVSFWIAKVMTRKDGKRAGVPVTRSPIPSGDDSTNEFVPGSEVYMVSEKEPTDEQKNQEMKKEMLPAGETLRFRKFCIPVYVGVGLRVSATVRVVASSANISGLGVIGAEAEANRLSGSLVVQTLGINGKSVAAALPIQSELNRTTAQNAIVAVASIKGFLYAEKDTTVFPRAVGLYLPFPGGRPLVNALISALSQNTVVWHRPCPPDTPAGDAAR